MRTLKVTLADGQTKQITANDVTEHYATKVCRKYGWDIYSPAWRDLGNENRATDEFLVKHASIDMFPGSTVEIVAEPIRA